MKYRIYIGVDPGSVSGCIAIIYLNKVGNIEKTETIEFAKYTTKEWFEKLRDITSSYGETNSESLAILEKVHSMPKQGVVSVGTFMKHAGNIEMALIALDIPFHEITPQTWMKFYGMKKEENESKTKWKRRLRDRLQRIMPTFSANNSNSDAMLIAYYAAMNF